MKVLAPLLGLCGLVLPIAAGNYGSYSSPYSFDAGNASNPSWMSAFPNSTNLTSLSIPGTHDTMTASSSLLAILQCQNQDLGTQLQAGIRYIDIRCTVVNDEFLVYHDTSYTGFTYTQVLQEVFSFLEKNPSEMILMRLKQEGEPINSTKNFEEVFNYYRLNDTTTAAGCAQYFWIPPSPGPTVVPTLGELRSKVLIIQNFGSDPAPYGIKWESPLFVVEDYYELTGYSEMDKKFSLIEQNLVAASHGSALNGGRGDGLMYLTHLSAYGAGVLPIEIAAGKIDGSIEGENDRTGKLLTHHFGENGTTGVVIMDFPGKNLIDAVVARNVIATQGDECSIAQASSEKKSLGLAGR